MQNFDSYQELANLIFPDITDTIEDLERRFFISFKALLRLSEIILLISSTDSEQPVSLYTRSS